MGKQNSKSLILFFILAFLFPWLIWGTSIAQNKGILQFHLPQSLAFWIGLTLATYIAVFATGGNKAFKDLLSRLIRWRVNFIWYFIALFTTLIISLLSIGVQLLIGGSHQFSPDFSISTLAPTLLFQIFFFWFTEETAWRGFALPRLQAKFNALTASLILGVLWGLWHIPLIFIPGSFQSTVPFIGFILSAIATSIMITWVFNNTRGSVLLAGLFHASTDVAIAYSNVMTGDLRLFWIFIIMQWVFVSILTVTQGAAHLSKSKLLDETIYSDSTFMVNNERIVGETLPAR